MKKIFISADHGMAIIYFLQSDVVPTLLDAGVEVVVEDRDLHGVSPVGPARSPTPGHYPAAPAMRK